MGFIHVDGRHGPGSPLLLMFSRSYGAADVSWTMGIQVEPRQT